MAGVSLWAKHVDVPYMLYASFPQFLRSYWQLKGEEREKKNLQDRRMLLSLWQLLWLPA